MFKNLRKKKKGFTLIELIIVIAIIAILAAVAIPKFGDVRTNAKKKSDIANAKTIANAATVLIGEGGITLPTTTTTPKKLTIDKASTTSGENDAEANKVEKYIQNVPIPKSTSDVSFTVEIDNDGNVIVKAGTSTFFPAPESEIQ